MTKPTVSIPALSTRSEAFAITIGNNHIFAPPLNPALARALPIALANQQHVVLNWKPQTGVPGSPFPVAEYRDGHRTILDYKGYNRYVANYANTAATLADKGEALKPWVDVEKVYTGRFAHNPARPASPADGASTLPTATL